MQGKIPEPHGGIPQFSEAVGWRIRFWWVGTCEWVEGEILSYRATDSRHLVLFADGESEWMSVSGETVWWLANTRERGNRLAPLGYGLDGAAIPKGRDAIEWRVDIYDRSLNQFLRGEIAEFDSVTGKHKIEYSNGHKPTWLSLTASKVIWRFPPGLPAPVSEPPTPREEAEPKSAVSQAAPMVPAKRSRSSNGGRKSVQITAGAEAAAPEGTTVLPKQKSRKLSTPSSPKSKGGKGKVTSGEAVFVRADSTVAIAEKSHQRAPEKKISPAQPTPAQPHASLARQSLARQSSDAAAAPARATPATEHVTKKQKLVSAKPCQPTPAYAPVYERTAGGKGSVPSNAAVPVVHQPAAPAVAVKPVSHPVGQKCHQPATVHRHSLRTPLVSSMLRPSPFTQVSLMSPTSLMKPASSFKDVRALLDATQKRATFIKDVLQFLDTLDSAPPAPPNNQPSSSHLRSPASTPALPTDPRRQPNSKSPAQPSNAVDVSTRKTPTAAPAKPPTTDAAPIRGPGVGSETATASVATPALAQHRAAVVGPGPPRFPKAEASKMTPLTDKQAAGGQNRPAVSSPAGKPAAVTPAGSEHIPFTPRFAPLSAIVHTAHALASGASVAAVTPAAEAKTTTGTPRMAVSRMQSQPNPAAVNAAGTDPLATNRSVPVTGTQPAATPASAQSPAQVAQKFPSAIGAHLPQLSVMQQAYLPVKHIQHARPSATQSQAECLPTTPDQTSSSGKDGGAKNTSTGAGGQVMVSESSPCSDIGGRGDKARMSSGEIEAVSDKGNNRDGPLWGAVDGNVENGNANFQRQNVSVAGTAAQCGKLARDSNMMLENASQEQDVDALNRSSSSNINNVLTSRLRWTGLPFGRVPALGLKGGNPTAAAAGSAGGRACG